MWKPPQGSSPRLINSWHHFEAAHPPGSSTGLKEQFDVYIVDSKGAMRLVGKFRDSTIHVQSGGLSFEQMLMAMADSEASLLEPHEETIGSYVLRLSEADLRTPPSLRERLKKAAKPAALFTLALSLIAVLVAFAPAPPSLGTGGGSDPIVLDLTLAPDEAAEDSSFSAADTVTFSLDEILKDAESPDPAEQSSAPEPAVAAASAAPPPPPPSPRPVTPTPATPDSWTELPSPEPLRPVQAPGETAVPTNASTNSDARAESIAASDSASTVEDPVTAQGNFGSAVTADSFSDSADGDAPQTIAATTQNDSVSLESILSSRNTLGGAGGKKNSAKGPSFFGISTEDANEIVFLIDVSSSMDGRALIAVKLELERAIQKLPATQSFCVASFNDQCVLWRNHLVPANDPANKDSAIQFVRGLSASGGTNMATAVQMAVSLKPQAIFLLTDGHPNNRDQVLSTLRGMGAATRSVHTIGLRGGGLDEALMKQIATEFNGHFITVE